MDACAPKAISLRSDVDDAKIKLLDVSNPNEEMKESAISMTSSAIRARIRLRIIGLAETQDGTLRTVSKSSCVEKGMLTGGKGGLDGLQGNHLFPIFSQADEERQDALT
ncbi:hypothetical protein QQP08_017452 [Theobroma cacao]|nr:hypothetical protein QQP08_017452 [Theobroma cacao]